MPRVRKYARRTSKRFSGASRGFSRKLLAPRPARFHSRLTTQRSNAIQRPYSFRSPLSYDPFPSGIKVDLKYSQNCPFTCGASGVNGSSQVFRLNSLFDPDLTGVGHQPFGYDQLTPVYRKYKVWSATVTLTWSSGTGRLWCSSQINGPDDASTTTAMTPDTIQERPNADVVLVDDISRTCNVQKFHVDMGKTIGMSPVQFASDIDGTTAIVTSNPVRQVLLYLAAAAVDGASAEGSKTVNCFVEIIFHSELWSRTTQSQS